MPPEAFLDKSFSANTKMRLLCFCAENKLLSMTEIIGWASSVILLMTLIKQVYKQWKERTGEGVSKWLFIGQLFASVGFTVYSYLVGNWVFTVTNAILTLNNIIGLWLSFYFRKKEGEKELAEQNA